MLTPSEFALKILYIILVLILYLLLRKLTGVGILQVCRDVKEIFGKLINDNSKKLNQHNSKNFNTKSKREKDKDKVFKAYRLVQDIILDLGWEDNKRMNVEYLLFLVLTCAFIIEFMVRKIITNLMVQIVMYFVIVYWIFTVLYIMSRGKAKRRASATREALTLICQNMNKNFQTTIEKIIDLLDPLVKGPFEVFLSEVNQNIPVDRAISNLELALGSQSSSVLHKVRIFTKSGKDGMIDTFKENIDLHANEKNMEIESEDAIQAAQREMWIIIGICVMTIFAGIAFIPGCTEIYKSIYGQITLLLESAFIANRIIAMERLDSQRYV